MENTVRHRKINRFLLVLQREAHLYLYCCVWGEAKEGGGGGGVTRHYTDLLTYTFTFKLVSF